MFQRLFLLCFDHTTHIYLRSLRKNSVNKKKITLLFARYKNFVWRDLHHHWATKPNNTQCNRFLLLLCLGIYLVSTSRLFIIHLMIDFIDINYWQRKSVFSLTALFCPWQLIVVIRLLKID